MDISPKKGLEETNTENGPFVCQLLVTLTSKLEYFFLKRKPRAAPTKILKFLITLVPTPIST